MARTMNIDPAFHNAQDYVLSFLMSAIGLIIAWLEPSKLLVLVSLLLATVKLVDAVIVLARRIRAKSDSLRD